MTVEPETFLKTVFVESWEEFKKEPVLYILAAIVIALLGSVTLGLLVGPLMVGFCQMTRTSLRGEEIILKDIFSGMSKLVPALLTMIVVALGVIVGSALLVLPGILFAIFAAFPFHFIAYADAPAGEALKGSFALVKENFLNVLLLAVILGVLNALGGTIAVGLLLTGPLSVIAMTVAFEKLTGLR